MPLREAIAATTGYLGGGVAGLLTGGFVAQRSGIDDLADLGVALMWMVVLAVVGAGLGCWIALRLAGARRGGVTALLAAAGLFAWGIALLSMLARTTGAVEAVVGWAGLAFLVLGVPLITRWIVVQIDRPTPREEHA